MQNEAAKEIIQGNEKLRNIINTLFAWKSEDLPTGILAMRKKVTASNKQFSTNGWDSICEAFQSPRLRKRALSYLCRHDTLSPTEAIAIVQIEIMRTHIKGDDVPAATA